MTYVIAKSVNDAAKQKNSRIAVDAAVSLACADAVFDNHEIFINHFNGHGSEIRMDGHLFILSLVGQAGGCIFPPVVFSPLMLFDPFFPRPVISKDSL